MILDAFRMNGQVAVVTGAGRGIGRGIAIAFAEAGADIVLAARRPATLEAVAAEIRALGRKALVVPTDVTELAQLDRLIDATTKEMGRLDTLVDRKSVV